MSDIVEAEWRPVVGYEGLYEVSAVGRVRRVGRAARSGRGRGGGARLGRVLRDLPNAAGYRAIQLWRNGQPKRPLVHTLVAAAFLGPCPEGHEVNHRDGDKANNAVENLEYLTRSENIGHAYATGLMRPNTAVLDRARAARRTKLTAPQVSEIRRRRAAGERAADLASAYGVSVSTIYDAASGRRWTRVG